MFQVQITKAEIVSSEDGKVFSAVIEGNFLTNSARQNDLLNFILNHPGGFSDAQLGLLSNGHDGFKLSASVKAEDFFYAMHVKDLREAARQQLFAQTGAQPSDEDVEVLLKKLLQAESDKKLADQVDEASSQAPSASKNAEGKDSGGSSSTSAGSSNSGDSSSTK